MKKILAIIGLISVSTLLHAQGWIMFRGSIAGISTNGTVVSPYDNLDAFPTGTTVGPTPSSSIDPLGYYYQLLYAPGGTNGWTDFSVLNADWTPVTTYSGATLLGTNILVAGAFSGNGGTAGVQVNLAASTAYQVMLVGWSSNLGDSWSQIRQEAVNEHWADFGYFGTTTVGTVTPFPTAGAGDPLIFPTVWANGSLTLLQVTPEPSTVVLAGLGGLLFLFWRRR